MGGEQSKPEKELVKMEAKNAKVTFPGINDVMKEKNEGNKLLKGICELAIDSIPGPNLPKSIAKLLLDYVGIFEENDQDKIKSAIIKCKGDLLWSDFKAEVSVIKKRLEAIKDNRSRDYDIQYCINRCSVILGKLKSHLSTPPLALTAAAIFSELFYIYTTLCVLKAKVDNDVQTALKEFGEIETFISTLKHEVIKQRIDLVKRVSCRPLSRNYGYEDKLRDDIADVNIFHPLEYCDESMTSYALLCIWQDELEAQVKMYKTQLKSIYECYFAKYAAEISKIRCQISHCSPYRFINDMELNITYVHEGYCHRGTFFSQIALRSARNFEIKFEGLKTPRNKST